MLNSGYILDKKYEVIKTLGQGGMSTVYLCKNIKLENLWAIKEIDKSLKSNVNFLTESDILKKLSHSGIPRIVDIFYENDNLYMVEDYIEGETLESYIDKNKKIDIHELCKIALSLSDIIHYLHSFRPPIIYRDLKPSNIMITLSGKIVLIDFGISRVYKKGNKEDTIYMGSKGYAAPEQYGMEQTCRQTDIYGLGAVIYFMINGKAPANFFEPVKNESYGENIDIRLKRVIQKAMQIDIDKRYNSIEEFQEELKSCLNDNTKTLLMYNEDKDTYTKVLTNTNVFKMKRKSKTHLDDFAEFKILKKIKSIVLEKIKILNKTKITKRNRKRKKVALVLAGIFIALLSGYLATDHGKKYDLSVTTSENRNQDSSTEDVTKNSTPDDKNSSLPDSNNTKEQSIKNIDNKGFTNKNNSPALDNSSSVKGEEKINGNGKSKAKSKHQNKK
ncbi:serine/threonine-protein kinase [Clostridium thailandense]|uniref:serine/threonine-protein kinase n=1 Tax=Clostridium thailandense TaxID=2794346 RepID=UPI003988AFE3